MSQIKVIREGSRTKWLQDGKRHRLDGPAITETNGTLKWFLNEKYHRLDGPAVI
jgi:hypothetical protein